MWRTLRKLKDMVKISLGGMDNSFVVSENVFVLLEIHMCAMVKSWKLSHMYGFLYSDLAINLVFHKYGLFK